MSHVTTWRYELPSIPHGDSWSIVFIDSTGCVAICSDYGDWCHRWQTRYCGYSDFRDFLVSAGSDYVANKLGSGRREELKVYAGSATRKNIRQHIRERRRSGYLSKEQARGEWELAGSDIEDGLTGFGEWLQQTSFSDAYELAIYRMSFGLEHWSTVSFPRLKAMLRAELVA